MSYYKYKIMIFDPPLVVRTLHSFRPPGRSSNYWFRPGPSGRPITRYRLCPSWLYLISVPLCTCLERSNVTALCLTVGSCKRFPDSAKFGVLRSRSNVHRWCPTRPSKWCSNFTTGALSCSVKTQLCRRANAQSFHLDCLCPYFLVRKQ